jgi:hypothetical protein
VRVTRERREKGKGCDLILLLFHVLLKGDREDLRGLGGFTITLNLLFIITPI